MRRTIDWVGFTLIGVCLLSLAVGFKPRLAAAADTEAKPISLTIDYADGSQRRFMGLAEEGQTVLDLLEAATKHSRGIEFKHRGSGIAAMVTEIDGLKNEGATGKNWLYKVNDTWGDRSCGVYKLQAGDAVLWTFGKEK